MNPALLEEFWMTQKASDDVRLYSSNIVEGVQTHQEELDALINRFATEWSLNRMPVVDRNILRCALFELLWLPDIPAKVTINEAIELAKRFADDESKRFVNGLLDRILQSDSRLETKRAEMMSPRE
ncbi:MAG: transcription antitermination factor NusB [Nitrospirales bacterium]|nr:transcription antitermination factor NusB [Nitrospirales bacterium]